MPGGFAYRAPYAQGRGRPAPRLDLFDASPHRSNVKRRGRNIHLLPIDYAFRPRLRGRLTLG